MVIRTNAHPRNDAPVGKSSHLFCWVSCATVPFYLFETKFRSLSVQGVRVFRGALWSPVPLETERERAHGLFNTSCGTGQGFGKLGS